MSGEWVYRNQIYCCGSPQLWKSYQGVAELKRLRTAEIEGPAAEKALFCLMGTQVVERCVKVVTEASAAVCGVKARGGFIRPRLESRRIMPTFNTKKEYPTA